MFKIDEKVYTAGSLAKILETIGDQPNTIITRKGRVPTNYYNISCSFDIETTSFYTLDGKSYTYKQAQAMRPEKRSKLEKYACMYIWQLGINGRVIVGRTWDEFLEVCKELVNRLGLKASKPEIKRKGRHLIIYVHNLDFEFQFIKDRFQWVKVFSRSTRTPLYAVSEDGLEFRCSWALTNSSLASVGEKLTKYKVRKMVGDLDYSLLRNSETKLTPKELKYCINDVLVVMAHIQAEIERLGGITKLPLTSTGYTRQHCRERCLYLWDWTKNDYLTDEKGRKIRNGRYVGLMKELQIKTSSEFNSLKRAFIGGHTHASLSNCYATHENIASYDFTSSYPTVMVSEVYPMSRCIKYYSRLSLLDYTRILTAKTYIEESPTLGVYKTEQELKTEGAFWVRRNLAIATFIFTGLQIKYDAPDSIIPSIKCDGFVNASDVVIDNCKVRAARLLRITATNIDFELYKLFYDFESVRIVDVYIYRADYLPSEFVRCVLELYKSKTKLKGVSGKEDDYQRSKASLNSLYGMCVTNPDMDDIQFTNNDGWFIGKHTEELTAMNLMEYNNSRSRFLYYPWGVFITAYARRNLMLGMYRVGQDDFIYCDTDSMKIRNRSEHLDYINAYNASVIRRLSVACRQHGIPESEIDELIQPKNQKGAKKPLGIWDFEGEYTAFKTIGAKRYITFTADDTPLHGSLSLTVAGLNKEAAVPYLTEKYKGNVNKIFDQFKEGMYIPPKGTKKLTSFYEDHAAPTPVPLTDYQGHTVNVQEKSFMHLEPASFTMSMLPEYLYLIGAHDDLLHFDKHPQERC